MNFVFLDGWWQIELTERSYIAYINIWTARKKNMVKRIDGAVVSLDEIEIGIVKQTDENQFAYSFEVKQLGLVIKVTGTSAEKLHLAEVQIFGTIG